METDEVAAPPAPLTPEQQEEIDIGIVSQTNEIARILIAWDELKKAFEEVRPPGKMPAAGDRIDMIHNPVALMRFRQACVVYKFLYGKEPIESLKRHEAFIRLPKES